MEKLFYKDDALKSEDLREMYSRWCEVRKKWVWLQHHPNEGDEARFFESECMSAIYELEDMLGTFYIDYDELEEEELRTMLEDTIVDAPEYFQTFEDFINQIDLNIKWENEYERLERNV